MRKLQVLLLALLLAVTMGTGFGIASAQTMSFDTDKLKGLSGKEFDIAFMQMMIQHHQSAVDMAKLGATNANHQAIKDLTAAIMIAQEKEISDMTGWLASWYNAKPDSMSGMAGMSSDATTLAPLKSDDFDKQFMVLMIPHHQSAIDMANLVGDRAEHRELKDMAKNIISSQSAEIDQMTGWLNQWYNVDTQGQPLVSTAGTTNTAATNNSGTTTTQSNLPRTGAADNSIWVMLAVAVSVLLVGGQIARRGRIKQAQQ